MDRRGFLMSGTKLVVGGTSLAILGGTVGQVQAQTATKNHHQEATPLLIDSHVHIWKTDPAFPYSPERKPPTEDMPVETLIQMMDENGVARTVLIQMIHYKWDNRYLASVLKRYPDRFHGVCRVNPEDPAAPDTLSALVADDGFQGVRISPYTDAQYDWIKGPLMPPLWRRTSELRIPMTVLTEASRLPQLVPLIEANPELTVVIDHMADVRPDDVQGMQDLLALARYPNVFVKISHMWKVSSQPYPYQDAQDQVKRLLAAYGADRLMWGTDWPVSKPQIDYQKIIALYSQNLEFLTPEEKHWILSGTVQRVWPFGL